MTSACAASISCTRFLYSIFLAIVVSLFAEGWERPSVSGTRLVCHRCPSVPCVPCLALPHPPPPASPLWLKGHPRPAPQVPSQLPHRAAALPSSHSFLGVRDCWASQGLCGQLSVTSPLSDPAPPPISPSQLSVGPRWAAWPPGQGPAHRRNRFSLVPSLTLPCSPSLGRELQISDIGS